MKVKLLCPHCKREYFLTCEKGVCKTTDAFFDAKNTELIAEKLAESGLEFGVAKEVKKTDE